MKAIRDFGIAFVVAFVVSFVLSVAQAALPPHIVEPGLAGRTGMILAMFTFLALSARAGNRKVSRVPDADRNRLLAEVPPAGYGVVYVYREGLAGKATGYDLFLDYGLVAQLKSPRFIRLVLPQGTHELSSGTKQKGKKEAVPGTPTIFTLAAGETAVFSLHLKTVAKKASMKSLVHGFIETTVDVVREAYTPGILTKLATVVMVAPIAPELARAA